MAGPRREPRPLHGQAGYGTTVGMPSPPPPDPAWRPIETAPRDGTRLKVWSPAVGEGVAWWIAAAEVWAEEAGSGYMAPHQDWTHWHPDPVETPA